MFIYYHNAIVNVIPRVKFKSAFNMSNKSLLETYMFTAFQKLKQGVVRLEKQARVQKPKPSLHGSLQSQSYETYGHAWPDYTDCPVAPMRRYV